MNTFLLEPTETLFFRDGRPMGGSLSGNGATWPMPHMLDSAFHAALHRAFPNRHDEEHLHRIDQDGKKSDRQRRFGSLVSAGPFPVNQEGTWWFPSPADAVVNEHPFLPTHFPSKKVIRDQGSLPSPLQFGVGSSIKPSKETSNKWWDNAAWESYLKHSDSGGKSCQDNKFFDKESQIGIGIDPETGTTGSGTATGKFYSAQYLRLKPGCKLGTYASALCKESSKDLLSYAFPSEGSIIVGGQQRVCSVHIRTNSPGSPLNLPLGLISGFFQAEGKVLVKWILLTPAIWPEIKGGKSKDGNPIEEHPGGWLPNWIDSQTGKVLLTDGLGKAKARRLKTNGGATINATLVSAIVGKALPVTGWSLIVKETGQPGGGTKSTHLAVPAGSVYYFETPTQTDAETLARNLNWHGTSAGSEIQKRRSTLLGEKGYGIGICGTWKWLENI